MKNIINRKNISRMVVPLVLVCAVAISLWYVAPTPAKALQIEISNPTTGTLGSTYSFTVTVNIEDIDILPIKSIDLEIYNMAAPSSYKASCHDLPLPDQASATDSRVYTSTETGGGQVIIVANTASNWDYDYDYRYAYGYQDPGGWWGGYLGYGYGYGSSNGVTSITFDVSWTPPTGWPTGNYQVKALVYGDATHEFIGTGTTFSLSSGGGGGGGGGGAGIVSYCKYVQAYTTASGRFIKDIYITSKDNNVRLDIAKDTIGLIHTDSLYTICIDPVIEPDLTAITDPLIIGSIYDIKPDGATYDPAITLTITYDPDIIPDGISAGDLVIATWDEDTGAWVNLEGCIVDTETTSISVQISHFTPFAIRAPESAPIPATFTTSDLTISPSQVEVGENVTISALITNTGNLSGSYEVTLEIDNVVEATEEVTLDGGASRMVYFTTAKDSAGTYTVSVSNLTGTFMVSEAGVPVISDTPASFTTTDLFISPGKVETGDSVTISVTITNTGDLSGDYEVTLEINGVTEATEELTLDGGASQIVQFTTTKDTAGNYTVNINDLTGSFTVSEPAVPPEPINSLLIGLIIAAAIVVVSIVTWLILRKRIVNQQV
ncbi:MAG: hypothetical protein JSW16_06695 [Dehalococcoidales bacterium]|nr:MAG: hypothetical protein JSW16_06695 [Dehalococcoidales bacterium]